MSAEFEDGCGLTYQYWILSNAVKASTRGLEPGWKFTQVRGPVFMFVVDSDL